MKKTFLFLAATMIFSTMAFAQKQGPNPKRLMAKVDTNQDGSISKQEAEEAERKGIVKNFDKIDTDNNSLLSETELTKFMEMRAERKAKREGGKFQPQKRTAAFDFDENGSISKEEAEKSGKKALVKHFDKFDKDQDGELNRMELKAFREKMKEKRANKED